MEIYGCRIIYHGTVQNLKILEKYDMESLGMFFNCHSYYDNDTNNYIFSLGWFKTDNIVTLYCKNYISLYQYPHFSKVDASLLDVSTNIIEDYRLKISSIVKESTVIIGDLCWVISNYVV